MAETRRHDVFSFGEKLLALLEEGSFTATYKYAVLLALIDLCLEHTEASGETPTSLSTTDLAEKIVEIYWPHTRDFATSKIAKVLRQNAGGQAEIVQAIRRHRENQGAASTESIGRTRRRSPDEFHHLVEFVEFKLIEMPLPRLQRFGKSDDRFLYDFRWNPDVRRGGSPSRLLRSPNPSARRGRKCLGAATAADGFLSQDRYQVNAPFSASDVDGFSPDLFSLDLVDNTQTAFGSDSLPLISPDLSSFPTSRTITLLFTEAGCEQDCETAAVVASVGSLTTVPEPSALLLMLTGLGGLSAVTRRKKVSFASK
jgi:PEP-CTERM motif